MEPYLKFAKDLAEEAAVIALKYFGFDTERTLKSDSSPLTLADTEINDLVIRRINDAYPEHSILGEEKSAIKEGSKYIWVCDPIDGTMPFSCGLPIFTFSLALVDQSNGQPILGVVNDPIMKNMYWAYKGSGAHRNGKKISVTKDPDIKNTYLNIDGSRKDSVFSKTQTMEWVSNRGGKSFKFLSFIYGGIQVANGKFSGSIFFGPEAHDSATLKIIVEEAGGRVTDLNGNERRYDEKGLGCVATNGLVHADLLKYVADSKIKLID